MAYDDAVEGVKLLISPDEFHDGTAQSNYDVVGFDLTRALNGTLKKEDFIDRYSPLSEKPTDDEKARRRVFTDLFNSAYALESHNEPDTLEGELEKLAISFRKP